MKPFTAFLRELNAQLGDEYQIYQEFAPKPIKDELKLHNNVGVLYVNGSSLNILPIETEGEVAGMSVECTLALAMKVPKTANLSDVIMEPLYVMTQAFQGQFYPADENRSYSYFVTGSLPTTDGALNEGAGFYYVNCEIAFTLTISERYSVYDGSNVEIAIGDSGWTKMGGIITATEANTLSFDTAALVNSGENKNIALSRTWALQVTAYNLPNDPVQQWLKNHVDTEPLKSIALLFDNELHYVHVQTTKSYERSQFGRTIYDFFPALDTPGGECRITLRVTDSNGTAPIAYSITEMNVLSGSIIGTPQFTYGIATFKCKYGEALQISLKAETFPSRRPVYDGEISITQIDTSQDKFEKIIVVDENNQQS